MTDLANPFNYAPLEEDLEPLPEQYHNVTASAEHWLGTTINLLISEMQRTGQFVDEPFIRRLNTIYAQHTRIFVMETAYVFEHRAYTIGEQVVKTIEDINAIWQNAQEQQKSVALHSIVPVYEQSKNTAMTNTPPIVVGYRIWFNTI